MSERTERLYHCLTEIDEIYLDRALEFQPEQKRQVGWRHWGALAALLALAVGLSWRTGLIGDRAEDLFTSLGLAGGGSTAPATPSATPAETPAGDSPDVDMSISSPSATEVPLDPEESGGNLEESPISILEGTAGPIVQTGEEISFVLTVQQEDLEETLKLTVSSAQLAEWSCTLKEGTQYRVSLLEGQVILVEEVPS